jgi:hypothetical protein
MAEQINRDPYAPRSGSELAAATAIHAVEPPPLWIMRNFLTRYKEKCMPLFLSVPAQPCSSARPPLTLALHSYTRPASGWASSVPSAKFTATAGSDDGELGTAVVLSADGRTLVGGASGNSSVDFLRGGVYVLIDRPMR